MILKLAAQVGIGIPNRDRFFPADKIIIHLCLFFRIKIGSIDRYITGECGIFRGQQKTIALIG